MNIAKFFIDRPIFAGVLSTLIFLGGLIAMFQLPISEYPDVVPPSVLVNAQFPGANPKVIAETVATPLEEQINGVDNMLYMYSQSTSDGKMTLTVTFELGTDPDLAQQLVQNRVSQALPRLPAVTRQLGVTTIKSSADLTMVVHLKSPNDRYDMLYLRNYAVLNVKDELAKIPGVGQVLLFGAGDYAMRLWLNPEKIAERNLTAGDVVNAVREQNVQIAAGIIGGAPYADVVELQLPVNAKGRLETPEEFEEIIIRTGLNGQITRLKDVAKVEMGASEYALRSLLNNKNAAAIPIFASPGANALDISNNVRHKMEELKKNFPEGLDYSVVYDPTVFVRGSIKAVIKTLLEAVALVVLVVILFLQTWRASIIPLLAVPVSIIGTFGLMYLFGFSINVLTLFGLILAIGIVVDDAIVVVENVERNIENGLSPKEATYKAMREVSGPIIAITLTLVAVFVPIAFTSGLTGQFYKQFALTIAISTVISAFNSLTLSPAIASLLLKPQGQANDWLTRSMNKAFGPFFQGFNRFFRFSSEKYSSGVGKTLARRGAGLALYVVLLVMAYGMFKTVPNGFVPVQDKQYLVSFAQLPDGATLDRTEAVLREMSDMALRIPGVAGAVGFPGLSINDFTNSSSAGIVFLPLDDFDQRTDPSRSAFAITQTLQQQYNGIEEAFVAIFPPPPVQGLGTIGGFKLQIEDRTDQGYQALQEAVGNVLAKAYASPELTGVFSSYKINVPQLYAELDRTKAKQLGLNINEVFEAMQVYLGSLYINDFNAFGRTYQVIAQAEKQFRDAPNDILNLKVRNQRGEMVPLGSIVHISETFGPESAQRYNAFRAADLNGNAAPGYSSGQAQETITRILEETLPQGMQFEWTDLTYQQILAGDTTMYVIPLVLFLVFLVLAAQYESLTLPLAIILIVPMSMLSALIGVWLSGGDNNIFTQISLFVLMGLATKNAILIVEFARELEHQGQSIVQAALEACRLRLRPILMTSFSFIMGVLPMAISSGAGAEMRNAMGIAVFSGMLGVTFFGLFLTPVFYVVLRKLETRTTKTEITKDELSHDVVPNN
ncbi:efflux RND transporter permease subunit [Candidatus Nitronereus thalassa]|uniref:Efflux RND transporter permease subunit n=1 Tax=Candidatus Nitronereus thalassa TaxID=3020898 RepID=A0ABU3KD23_9BACT|nr:efflux RND transporter permease subunit [Candidatus Nitronereus thalassa]MDT7044283.1 efflux RND transporter permease subunit [Candidatus Nitronereus thalassa]